MSSVACCPVVMLWYKLYRLVLNLCRLVLQGKLDTEELLTRSGVNFTSIRPVYIYGPLNYNPVEEFFFHRIKAGRPICVPGSGMQVGGWTGGWGPACRVSEQYEVCTAQQIPHGVAAMCLSGAGGLWPGWQSLPALGQCSQSDTQPLSGPAVQGPTDAVFCMSVCPCSTMCDCRLFTGAPFTGPTAWLCVACVAGPVWGCGM